MVWTANSLSNARSGYPSEVLSRAAARLVLGRLRRDYPHSCDRRAFTALFAQVALPLDFRKFHLGLDRSNTKIHGGFLASACNEWTAEGSNRHRGPKTRAAPANVGIGSERVLMMRWEGDYKNEANGNVDYVPKRGRNRRFCTAAIHDDATRS